MRLLIVFCVSFGPVVIAAPILYGNYTGPDTLRYSVFPLFMTGLHLALAATMVAPHKTLSRIGKAGICAALLAALVLASLKISATGLHQYFTYYPESTRKLDELAVKEGLTCGVGNYWNAKLNTMFSRRQVKVYAVFEDLSPWEHVVNEHWFFGTHQFNFVLLNQFNDTLGYQKKLTTTRLISSEPDCKLVKTNRFKYDKKHGYNPVNL